MPVLPVNPWHMTCGKPARERSLAQRAARACLCVLVDEDGRRAERAHARATRKLRAKPSHSQHGSHVNATGVEAAACLLRSRQQAHKPPRHRGCKAPSPATGLGSGGQRWIAGFTAGTSLQRRLSKYVWCRLRRGGVRYGEETFQQRCVATSRACACSKRASSERRAPVTTPP